MAKRQDAPVAESTDKELLESEYPTSDPAFIERVKTEQMVFAWADPRTLRPHENNPKSHPSAQREAFSVFLEEFSWLKPLVFNVLTDKLLDGHMRQTEALEKNMERVPVVYVAVPPKKEGRALVFLDAIGRMFQFNDSKVDALLAEDEDPVAGELLKTLDRDEENLLGDGPDIEPEVKPLPHGGLDLVLGESFHYVVMLFRTEIDWLAAQDIFGLKRVRCAFSSSIGQARVVDGSKYLKKVHSQELQKIRDEAAADVLGDLSGELSEEAQDAG